MSEEKYHHGNLKKALIEAGITLIDKQGVKALSLRKLADLCGVSPGAPYKHFKSKEDLLYAMQAHISNQLSNRMQEIIDSYSDKSSPDLMIALGKCYVMFFMHNPHYFSFLFSESQIYANLNLDENDSESFYPFELFKTTALPIFRAYGIPEHRLEDAVISSWATVHGLSAMANMKNLKYSKSWENKIEDFLINYNHNTY